MKTKLGAKELRTIPEDEAKALSKNIKCLPIFLILEDVLDTYNVGGFFRLSEALTVKKVYLCGKTQTPPDPKIIKASVGTYKLVDWEYKRTAQEALLELQSKHKDLMSIAIEQHPRSHDYKEINYHYPLAFILGNENYGMKQETLKAATEVCEVPMYGMNKSLNVMVAAGIVLYYAVEVGVPSSK